MVAQLAAYHNQHHQHHRPHPTYSAPQGRLVGFNLRDLANAAWGLAILGHPEPSCMQALGRAAAGVLGSGFNAQECARILYAMGKSGVECPELASAAGESQDLDYTFPAPVGVVALKQQLGGTGGKWDEREGTGAIAGNGGALFEDSYVLADWLARQSDGPSAVLEAAGMLDAEPGPEPDFGKSWSDVVAVELGAGIGLCSVVSSRLGMKVIATDGDESVLNQLAANAARNSSGAGTLQPALLKWGDDSTPLEDELEAMSSNGANGGDGALPGLVMATGCVYGRDAGVWAALAKVIRYYRLIPPRSVSQCSYSCLLPTTVCHPPDPKNTTPRPPSQDARAAERAQYGHHPRSWDGRGARGAPAKVRRQLHGPPTTDRRPPASGH